MVITHNVALFRVSQYLKKMGWIKEKNVLLKSKKQMVRPDGTFKHRLATYHLVIEVKPDLAGTAEIQKGIGQVLYWLPYSNIRTILVVSEEHAKWLTPIFNHLNDRCGLLIYDTKCQFKPVKNTWSEFNKDDDLTWLETETLPGAPKLTLAKTTPKKASRKTFEDVQKTLGWRMFKDEYIHKVNEVRQKYPDKDADWVFTTARCLLLVQRKKRVL